MENLSEKDKALYLERRSSYFKGTIAVSVIYGVLALGLFIVATLNEKIKMTLQTDLMPFLLTMIIGILVVIGFLLLMLFTYKPSASTTESIFTNTDCPDFWTRILNPSASDDQRVKCNSTDGHLTNQELTSIDDLAVRATVGSLASVTASPNKLNCNMIYPMQFAKQDYMLSQDINTNQLRCAYAKACKVPWSSACPNADIPYDAPDVTTP